MIRLWCPGIYLNAVFESNNKKLDALILDDLEVNSTLEISYINPSISTLNLLEMTKHQQTNQTYSVQQKQHSCCTYQCIVCYAAYSLRFYYTWRGECHTIPLPL